MNKHYLETAPLDPAPAPRRRITGTRRPAAPAASPAPRARKERAPALALHTLGLVALVWWLFVDGPQSFIGVGAWFDYAATWLGTPDATLGEWPQWSVYGILTVAVNALWFFSAAWWRYFRASWKRLFQGLILFVAVLLPLTIVDVLKGAGGAYALFGALRPGQINEIAMIAALVWTAAGSVGMQLVALAYLRKQWVFGALKGE